MEEWELEFYWLKLRHHIKDSLNHESLPDLQAILFLIGIQELGRLQSGFTKEEKQDLMHIGICTLLSNDGYYEFVGRDQDGWPHWKKVKKLTPLSLKEQERLLQIKAIEYFEILNLN